MEILVREYQRPVYNTAFRMLGNADEAADVTQTTFLKALEGIEKFDTKFRFFSWIYRIALNESIDHLKRSKRFEPYADSPSAERDQPPDQLARLQAADQLQLALMELKEELRSVLVLRYFTDCSYEQIGEILDLPSKTVKSRLFAARQKLKSALQQHGVTSP